MHASGNQGSSFTRILRAPRCCRRDPLTKKLFKLLSSFSSWSNLTLRTTSIFVCTTLDRSTGNKDKALEINNLEHLRADIRTSHRSVGPYSSLGFSKSATMRSQRRSPSSEGILASVRIYNGMWDRPSRLA
jgi:hypothetical protein